MASLKKHLKRLAKGRVLNLTKKLIGFLYLLIGAPGCKSKLITFVIHEVSDEARGHPQLTNTFSTKKNFLKQISLLSSYFEMVNPLENPSWVNQKGCLISFDDGYRGGLEAAKILEGLQIASIHHLNLETIYGQINSSSLVHFVNHTSGHETEWSNSTPQNLKRLMANLPESELQKAREFSGPYMNPKELQELTSLKYVVIGDHLLNHWYTNSLTNEEVLENLSLSTSLLRFNFTSVPIFAAPHGNINLQKMELISAQGYDVIFAGSSWKKVGSTSVIPRIDLNNSINSKLSLFGAIAIFIVRSKKSKI